MAGFTLGGSAGATLGEESGATLGGAIPDNLTDSYLLDGQPVATLTDEVATYRTLSLRWRVEKAVLTSVLRPAKENEGQVDVLVTDSGGFVAVDRSGGANSFRLTPPKRRDPLRRTDIMHVSRYEEELISQSVGEWNVEIEFARSGNRTDSPSISITEQVDATAENGGTLGEGSGFTLGDASGATVGNGSATVPSDWWGIETRHGTIATDRVDARFMGTGADGVGRYELVARLTKEQAHVFEAALARLDGVRIREVSDGSNIAVDDTDDDANTVTVDSPTEEVVASGEYVVTAWDSERLNDAYQSVSFEIATKG